MAYQQKPGDIAVFRERDKRNDKAPDWRGTLVVPEGAQPGDKLEVALWARNDGMLAGSLREPRERQHREAVSEQNRSRRDDADRGSHYAFAADVDDEIPF